MLVVAEDDQHVELGLADLPAQLIDVFLVAPVALAHHLEGELAGEAFVLAQADELVEAELPAAKEMPGIFLVVLGPQGPLVRFDRKHRAVRSTHAKNDVRHVDPPWVLSRSQV